MEFSPRNFRKRRCTLSSNARDAATRHRWINFLISLSRAKRAASWMRRGGNRREVFASLSVIKYVGVSPGAYPLWNLNSEDLWLMHTRYVYAANRHF